MELLNKNESVTIALFCICALILILLIFFNLGAYRGVCQGQVLTKVKTSDGQTRLREAKVSFHEPSANSDEQTSV